MFISFVRIWQIFISITIGCTLLQNSELSKRYNLYFSLSFTFSFLICLALLSHKYLEPEGLLWFLFIFNWNDLSRNFFKCVKLFFQREIWHEISWKLSTVEIFRFQVILDYLEIYSQIFQTFVYVFRWIFRLIQEFFENIVATKNFLKRYVEYEKNSSNISFLLKYWKYFLELIFRSGFFIFHRTIGRKI